MSTIVVVKNYDIVLTTDDVQYLGPAIPFISALLLEQEINDSYITGTYLFPCLALMNKIMQDTVPGWKIRISSRNRKTLPIKGQVRTIGTFFVDYIAIDQRIDKIKRKKRKRIDILNLDLLYTQPPRYEGEQLQAAEAIIKLQRERGLKQIRQTKGAIGTALLKASPNWEKKRHAAPRFINRAARSYLPGNFYSISNRVKQSIASLQNCYYLDQTSAHHNIVQSCTIPHPHSIRGRGYYQIALRAKDYYPVWTRPTDSIGACICNAHHSGLVLAKIHVSTLPPTKEHLYPPWARKRGSFYCWLWTPELRLFLHDHRLQLDSFVAGFTGSIDDMAVTEYGTWALNYQQRNPRDRKYTKAFLLAAYGMLAFNKDNYKDITRYWGGQVKGNRVILPEAGTVSERVIKLSEEIQHPITNVIARGIIESETRTRSLEYAKHLDNEGHHIAQIYVDGLVVQSEQLPFIQSGWRLASELSNVVIPHSNWLFSDQLVKTPGFPRTECDEQYMKKLERARAPFIPKNKPLDKLDSFV